MDLSAFYMSATFAVIGFAIVGFALERITVELTALAALLMLIVVFAVIPEMAGIASPLDLQDLLNGFANPALLTVLALVIVGQALFQTGALDKPTEWLSRSRRLGTGAVTALAIVTAVVLSAFLNNTPVVVLFIPVLATLARDRGISPSKVLMALSFATILGGATTLIGSSTNLLVAGTARRLGAADIGFFDVTIPGVVLACAGLAYVFFVMPFLMRERETDEELITSGKHFITELVLDPGSPFVGQTSKAGLFPGLKDITVRRIERGKRVFVPPYDDLALQPGDRLLLAGTRGAFRSSGALFPRREDEARQEAGTPAGGLTVAEAVLAPGSRLIGRSPRDTHLSYPEGAGVVGVERRGRMGRQSFGDIRLEPGDVLLVAGDDQSLDALRRDRDLLILERSLAPLPDKSDALKAGLVFAIMVIMAAGGFISIAVASLMAAFAMLAFGCLNIRQAKRAFDSRIYMLVGASIAMASALERTGGAEALAEALIGATYGIGPLAVVSALFLVVALMTNVLSNNATAVLFTPIAISAARTLDAPVEPFLFTVIFGANASFATPIGYQTNLLVMRPGGYTFRDFVIAGTPLAIILWVTYTLFASWYYDL